MVTRRDVVRSLVVAGVGVEAGPHVVLAVSDGNAPSVWFVVATSAALAVIMPALFYPFTKTIWVAAEIMMNRFDPNK